MEISEHHPHVSMAVRRPTHCSVASAGPGKTSDHVRVIWQLTSSVPLARP
jgi:hypothetical protein